jgi:hypothetical protein
MKLFGIAPLSGIAAAALFAAAAPAHATYTISGTSVEEATIQFIGTGDQILFPDGIDDRDHMVTLSSDTSLVGLQGNIDGEWMIGAITTVIAGLQTAPVTGGGSFSIDDGMGGTFSGMVSWSDVSSFGTNTALNFNGLANLTGITYDGTQATLSAIEAVGSATLTVSAQFTAPRSLSTLTTDGNVYMTSYSYSLAAVPEPSTYALIGMGLVGVGLSLRGRRAPGRRIG